jgi:hypothetical protein
MSRSRVLLAGLVGAAISAVCAGCGGNSTSITSPADTTCTFTVTMTSFTSTPSPVQGLAYASFFSTKVFPPASDVYLVDVNAAPPGCLTPWTAVSTDTSAVQLSPAAGRGRGQVELFIPANGGAPRSTAVTIAGQAATIAQAGR